MIYSKKFINFVVYALYALCAALLLVDVFYHKHGHFAFEEWFGFYAFYGFIGCVAIVLSAIQLRKILMRDEDYYD
ncbi:MAG: hypothetical protein AB8C40_05485 [Gammaproteobacteria bacterium]